MKDDTRPQSDSVTAISPSRPIGSRSKLTVATSRVSAFETEAPIRQRPVKQEQSRFVAEARDSGTSVQLRSKNNLLVQSSPKRLSATLELLEKAPEARSSPPYVPDLVQARIRAPLMSSRNSSVEDEGHNPSPGGSTQSSLKSKALYSQPADTMPERPIGRSGLRSRDLSPLKAPVEPNPAMLYRSSLKSRVADDSDLPLTAAERAPPGTELPVKASEEFRKQLTLQALRSGGKLSPDHSIVSAPLASKFVAVVEDEVVVEEEDKRLSDLMGASGNGVSNWVRSVSRSMPGSNRPSPPPGFLM